MVTQDEIKDCEEVEDALDKERNQDRNKSAGNDLSENRTKAEIVDNSEEEWSSHVTTKRKQPEKGSSALTLFSSSNISSSIGVSARYDKETDARYSLQRQ